MKNYRGTYLEFMIERWDAEGVNRAVQRFHERMGVAPGSIRFNPENTGDMVRVYPVFKYLHIVGTYDVTPGYLVLTLH